MISISLSLSMEWTSFRIQLGKN